jgi:PAS domain S-box-containing protein
MKSYYATKDAVNLTDNPVSRKAHIAREEADAVQTRHLLCAVLEATTQGVITFDSSETILQVNAGTLEIYGYSREELIGQRVEILLPAQFLQTPVRQREYGFRMPRDHHPSEFVARRKDGSEFPAEVTLSFIPSETGAARAAFVTDTSLRKRQEEALRKNEEQLRLLIEHAPGAIAMFDREMCYLIASRRWLADYKLSGDLQGRSLYEIVPEIPEHWKAAHRRALAGETLKCEGERFVRADGTVQWVKWDLVPWRTATGEIGGVVIAAEEITARKEAELKVRESEERLDLAVRGSSDGIWDANLVTGQDYLSDRALELLGFQTGELPSRYEGWELRIHPDDRERALHRLKEHFDKRVPFDVEYRLRVKSGDYRWFRSRGRAVWDQSGKPVRMAGSITDITERVLLQQHLQHALAELAQLKNQLEAENLYLQEEIKSSYNFEEIVGESEQLRWVFRKVEQVASTNATVLITGETGTGKELFARAIHSRSMRKEHPLVKVNCAALPANLIESDR